MLFATKVREFVKNSIAFLKRSSKPSEKEYAQITRSVFTGFLIMGSISYIIKLVHIPINNIIVGGSS
ncbi:MAG: protein transporter Sec61 subunit gamma [Amphiamblys sp. WSBS2006]|nr:MAG: protein transporter Sec61 subunit gamma [Amphiamblys sp. WSBS2006]